jgi:hypothetical protein
MAGKKYVGDDWKDRDVKGTDHCTHSRDRLGCHECAARVEHLRAGNLIQRSRERFEREQGLRDLAARKRAEDWVTALLVDLEDTFSTGMTISWYYECEMPPVDVPYAYVVELLQARGFNAGGPHEIVQAPEDLSYDGPRRGSFVVWGWT